MSSANGERSRFTLTRVALPVARRENRIAIHTGAKGPTTHTSIDPNASHGLSYRRSAAELERRPSQLVAVNARQTIPFGFEPTAIVLLTVNVPTSTTETLSAPWLEM